MFDNTKLEKSNFLTSYNFSIDPEKNLIRKAKFSQDRIEGLLYKYDIIVE